MGSNIGTYVLLGLVIIVLIVFAVSAVAEIFVGYLDLKFRVRHCTIPSSSIYNQPHSGCISKSPFVSS